MATSLFLAHPCVPPEANAAATKIAWCQRDTICAVASNTGRVSFFGEEGTHFDRCVIVRDTGDCVSLEWQGESRILATGWSDGHVSCWAVQEGGAAISCIFSNEREHAGASVDFLLWNPLGSRLVTGDKAGHVRVWKADARGVLSAYKEYRASGGITTGVFCTNAANRRKAAAGSDLVSHSFSPPFFIGTDEGEVFYADDLGHRSDVQSLRSPIDALKFYDERSRLIIVTRSLLMTQLSVGDDGKVRMVEKITLSVAGKARETGLRELTWAGPGVLAAACGEQLIRLWDLAAEENYVMSLSAAGECISRSDRATCVAFNPLQRYLAVGTAEGMVAMWQFVGEYGDKFCGAADDWRVLQPTPIGRAPVTALSWGPGQGLLIGGMEDGACILGETVLHRVMCEGIAVEQLSADTLRVSHVDAGSYRVRANINVVGVAVSGHHLLTWSGKECEAYELHPDQAVRVGTHPTTAKVMAVRGGRTKGGSAGDTIYRCDPNKARVELCNMGGVCRESISFTEAEGTPTLLDINGDYLAVMTSIGLIKVFKVGRGVPKPQGSAGRFVDAADGASLGEGRSIRVNADGKRVSILSSRVHGTTIKVREPDTRLHVYDRERDTVEQYDFLKTRRLPMSHFWDPAEPRLLAVETHKMHGQPPVPDDAPPSDDAAAKAGAAASDAKDSKGMSPDKKKGPLSSVITTPGGSRNDQGLPPTPVAEQKIGRDLPDDDNGGVKAAPVARPNVSGGDGEEAAEVEISTMFAAEGMGILPQDVFALDRGLQAMVGIAVPRLYFSSAGGAPDGSGDPGLKGQPMRDFVGLEDVDMDTRAALLDFSYYLTIGNMDAAHGAVKLIKNKAVWQNMAHMCVKTKRLDVAEVCLGNMEHASGAAAVRYTKEIEPEPEAAVAQVAIQLGMLNDAARLYRECRRYDLLNVLYQAAGDWDRALDCASRRDRIHLRTTHHRYAKHLEEYGDVQGAITHYEKANTHRTNVPRMLFEMRQVGDLERYINHRDDPELLKWWAAYCESQGHLDKARSYYEGARDYHALVRVACAMRQIEPAIEIVETKMADKDKPAACYHLARTLESMDEWQEAISFYAQAGCYNHAIRLAKRFQLDSDLMQYALKTRPVLMIECAEYFEGKGDYQKAVQLYQKGGDLRRALDVCEKAAQAGGDNRRGGKGEANGIFAELQRLTKELPENASDMEVARCAEFFMQHEQYDQAVQFYITSKNYTRAVDLCVNYKVKISEEMAEQLTPPKEGTDPDVRKAALVELARALKKQGAFQLACKKYTQAGNRQSAMKALLKSGDTKSIIYYASVSRNQDIYFMAANYLQNLDWQNDEEIMKKIDEFYKKAKKFESLSAFYNAYAQMMVDDLGEYDEALTKLKQAETYMKKAKELSAGKKEENLASLRSRIDRIEQFCQARSMVHSDPDAMVKVCSQLINGPVDDVPPGACALRLGDVYAELVNLYFAQATNGLPAKDVVTLLKADARGDSGAVSDEIVRLRRERPKEVGWLSEDAFEGMKGTASWTDAFDLIRDMHEANVPIKPYVDKDILLAVQTAVGRALPGVEVEDDGEGKHAGSDDGSMAESLNESLGESMGEESMGEDAMHK